MIGLLFSYIQCIKKKKTLDTLIMAIKKNKNKKLVIQPNLKAVSSSIFTRT